MKYPGEVPGLRAPPRIPRLPPPVPCAEPAELRMTLLSIGIVLLLTAAILCGVLTEHLRHPLPAPFPSCSTVECEREQCEALHLKCEGARV